MGNMICRDHRGSNSLRYFQGAVSASKMNPALEELQIQKLIIMW